MGLVIVRLLLSLAMVAAMPCFSRADMSAEAPGREAFEAGVDAASRASWSEAAIAFETSLREVDRPATRFNLVLVYAELGRSLEVAKHAIAFLRLPEEPSRASARTKVADAFDQATASLAVLTTESLPATATLRVDGEAPTVMDDERRIYLQPGAHRLEAVLTDHPSEILTLSLTEGQTTSWPRVAHQAKSVDAQPPTSPEQISPTSVPEPSVTSLRPEVRLGEQGLNPTSQLPDLRADLHPPSRARRALAWSLGAGGGLAGAAALATFGVVMAQANDLGAKDIDQEGVPSASKEYRNLQQVVAPLAMSGSAAIVAAIAIAPRTACWRHPAVTWSALIASSGLMVAGTFLAVRTPDNVGDLRVDAPSRQAGSLLLGSAFPLLTAGLKSVWRLRSGSDAQCQQNEGSRE